MQEGTTHAAALDRLRAAGGYLAVLSAEAGPLLCPSWPTTGTWNPSTHINYYRFLDAANGGPISWETMQDSIRKGPVGEGTGVLDSTNCTICFLQQQRYFTGWWAAAEAAQHVGLSACFLFGFGSAKAPGHPSLRGFAEQLAFPLLKNMF